MNTENHDPSESQQVSALMAYKRAPDLSNSRWYKGILTSQMAGTADNHGAFDLLICKTRRGTEPPPHVHSREDEFFYVLSGAMTVYVGGTVLKLTAGECMFLPRQKPHAFLITSDVLEVIVFMTPGGFLDAVNRMNAPAGRMDLPTDPDLATYAAMDLTDTMKLFDQYGVRFLTPEETRIGMPQYPA
jgi:mannose-6-phosphate isomerase-like protein (cupin superfamily)